jgi:hypothetical protein
MKNSNILALIVKGLKFPDVALKVSPCCPKIGCPSSFSPFNLTDQNLTAPVSSVGTNLVSVSLTDPEGLTPFSMSLSGLSANSMSAVPQNAASSSYQLQNSVVIGTGAILFYTASVFDSYNQETQYKRSLTIASASVAGPLWYAYIATAGQFATTDEDTARQYFEDVSLSGTPQNGYLFGDFASGDIGTSLIQSSLFDGLGDAGENTYLIASGSILSGSNSVPFLSNLDQSYLTTGSNANSLVIVFPSSSEIGINPTSMRNSVGTPSSNGVYALYGDRPGTNADGAQVEYVRYYNLNVGTYPNSSATRFGVIFTNGDGSPNVTYFFMAASGSTPTSTQ